MKNQNYFGTFIEVADDCPVSIAEVPQAKGDTKTVPQMQYEMIAKHPYKYKQEDVLFEVYADRNNIPKADRPKARAAFLAKDQPCLRSSSLGKRYGWGIHNDENGKVALYAVESKEYKKLVGDKSLTNLKALRSSRA